MPERTPQLKLLKDIFGYDSFRPLQGEIIDAVLQKRDALVVMPTGGGKSLCYQIPALIFSGLTIVVSPLISLMQDQVQQMRELGIAAVFLNSSLERQEYVSTLNDLRDDKIKLLYVAPETLLKNDILKLMSEISISCIAIDEAHCISEWGHDFRPEYRMLASVRQRFPGAVCVALTATATERVRADIRKSLGFSEAADYVASFNRPNLYYKILPKDKPLEQVLEFIKEYSGESGVIYCFSRDRVDRLYSELKQRGYVVKPYHAGLSDEERRSNQELFLRDKVQIMVATLAFGMGIHKTNVRYVIHYDLPKSVEAYYQETGRAGRDGVNSTCLLLYSYSDIHKIKYFIGQKSIPSEIKSANQQLDALVEYAESTKCRRIPLLKYFGEDYSLERCGHCDNCVTPPVVTDDITRYAQMFLSCVKRVNESFGQNHIVEILRGSKSKKVLDLGHDKLSTHGIGSAHSKEFWQSLSRQFLRHGLIFQDTDGFGVLKLTEKGYAVMKGSLVIMGDLSIKNKAASSKSAESSGYDDELFDELRKLRRELAEMENVPPYVIFSDKTLGEMTLFYPQDQETLLLVNGVGVHKAEKYGEAFLKIIISYCKDKGITDSRGTSAATGGNLKKPRYIEIGELYNSGISLSAIEKQESLKRSTVVSYLNQYLLDGYVLEGKSITEYLPDDGQLMDNVISAFNTYGAEKLKPAFEALDGVVDYDTLHLYRLHYMNSRNK